MADDFPSNDIQALWTSQQGDAVRLAAGQVRLLAATFQQRIRRRNRIEYAGAAIGIAGQAVIAAMTVNAWVRAGALMAIAGVLYVCYQLNRRASASVVPEQLGTSPAIDFHRAQLERQRDALRSMFSWYILPILPGLLIVLIAGARSRRHMIVNLCLAGVMFVTILWLNRRGARRLQAEIDRLTPMTKGDMQ